MLSSRRPVSLLIAVLAGGAEARAGTTDGAPEAPAERIRVDWVVDGAVTGVAGVSYVLSEIFLDDLAPGRCAWCDDPANPVDEGARDALKWRDEGTAAILSDVTAHGLGPVAAYGLTALAGATEHRLRLWPADALVVTEAFFLAADLNQIVKLGVARQRPYVRDRARGGEQKAEDNLSFFSGHTRATFSLAVASGTVASLRRYRLAPAIWASGLTLAVATGYFRLAADKHYLTDVLTGAVVGSAVGFAVPWFLHRGPGDAPAARLDFEPLPGGGFASVTTAF